VQALFILSLWQVATFPPPLTAYSPLINTSAQLLLAINPYLSSFCICTRSTKKGWTGHPATLVDWTTTRGTIYQSSTYLGTIFFALWRAIMPNLLLRLYLT
jgi:hypothetical protein